MARWPILVVPALAGCGSPPPPPSPPTVVSITLRAAPDDNPTETGQGAPLSLRIYQLGSSASFTGADFFPLYDHDAAVLSSDLIHRDNVLLAPGQTTTETLKPDDSVRSVAFFAGYRDQVHATWRASADVAPHRTTRLTVLAGKSGLVVKTEPPPLPKPAGS